MRKFFGNTLAKEEKPVQTAVDPFPNAIKALERLMTFFQEYENIQGNNLTIELESSWQKTVLLSSDTCGIWGRVALKNIKGSPSNIALYKALNDLGLSVGRQYSTRGNFSGDFSLYHMPTIENIPKKVDSIIEDYDELLAENGSSLC